MKYSFFFCEYINNLLIIIEINAKILAVIKGDKNGK